MIYVCGVIIFFLLVTIGVLFAFHSKSIPIDPIENIKDLKKMASVWGAWFSGFLIALVPIADQTATILPSLNSIQALNGLTHSPGYLTFVALFTGVGLPLLRAWRQGILMKRPNQTE